MKETAQLIADPCHRFREVRRSLRRCSLSMFRRESRAARPLLHRAYTCCCNRSTLGLCANALKQLRCSSSTDLRHYLPGAEAVLKVRNPRVGRETHTQRENNFDYVVVQLVKESRTTDASVIYVNFTSCYIPVPAHPVAIFASFQCFPPCNP